MDLERPAAPQTTLASLLVGGLSLLITLYASSRTQSKPDPQLRIYNALSGEGLSSLSPKRLHADARTNRTLWEAVDSRALHAGLERLEPGAWVPPHAHATEEVIVVLAGRAHVFDEAGQRREMAPGALLHIAARARHAFRNAGTDPFFFVWLFPKPAVQDKFSFHQRYGKGR